MSLTVKLHSFSTHNASRDDLHTNFAFLWRINLNIFDNKRLVFCPRNCSFACYHFSFRHVNSTTLRPQLKRFLSRAVVIHTYLISLLSLKTSLFGGVRKIKLGEWTIMKWRRLQSQKLFSTYNIKRSVCVTNFLYNYDLEWWTSVFVMYCRWSIIIRNIFDTFSYA